MKIFKGKWSKIITIILLCGVTLTAIGGLSVFALKETKTISSREFSRGGLDDYGIHYETKQSIYTKEAFECSGLRIEQDFEFHGTYDVYFYDYNSNFLVAHKDITGVFVEDLELAKYARVVIHPEIPADSDADEYKIGYFEVVGIAKNLDITVDKNSSYKYSDSANLFNEDRAVKESNTKKVTLSLLDEDSKVVYKKYDVWVNVASVSDSSVTVTMSGENVLETDITKTGWTVYSFAVGSDCPADCLVTVPASASCYIFGYN